MQGGGLGGQSQGVGSGWGGGAAKRHFPLAVSFPPFFPVMPRSRMAAALHQDPQHGHHPHSHPEGQDSPRPSCLGGRKGRGGGEREGRT